MTISITQAIATSMILVAVSVSVSAADVAAIATGGAPLGSAHEPRYENASLWPADVMKAAYAREQWPKARLLVWAKPGQSARDGTDPKCWLEDGKPAARTFDANTDLLLPDADKNYWVAIQGRKYQPAPCRHVTIGKGAGLVWQHSAGGNTWVRKGGSLQYLDSFVGDKHAFCRNDNDKPINLVDHLYVKKAGGASVEFLGPFSTDDELSVQSGTMILGPGSEFAAGDRTTVTIQPEASLVLLSGSYFHRRHNCDWGRDVEVTGKLMAGTPQRPLTMDCRIGLSYKSKGVFQGTKRDARMPAPDDYGLFIAPSGLLSIHSTDPKTARLVLNCAEMEHDAAQVRILGEKTGDGAGLLAKLKGLPHKIDAALLGKIEMDGILFDDMRNGGIRLLDPSVRLQWKNVFYGERNEGKPDDLCKRFEGNAQSR